MQDQEALFLCLRHLAFLSLGFLICGKRALSTTWVCYEKEMDQRLHNLPPGAEGMGVLKPSPRSILAWAEPPRGRGSFTELIPLKGIL